MSLWGDDVDEENVPDTPDDTITKGILNDTSNNIEIVSNTNSSQTKQPNRLETSNTFESLGISKDVIDAIYEYPKIRIVKPSTIQVVAIPYLLEPPYNNFIGQAQSGTGKTLAFIVSMIERCDPNIHQLQALCVSPTRELVVQTYDVLLALGKYKGLTSGMAIPRDKNEAREEINWKETQIVIASPGVAYDLIKNKRLDLSTLKIFVLDEADSFFGQQNSQQKIEYIMKAFSKTNPPQICLFSATYSPLVAQFVEFKVDNPYKVFLKPEEISLEYMYQTWINCKSIEKKYDVLKRIYAEINQAQCMIFVHTRRMASILNKKLNEDGFEVSVLHGKLSLSERDQIMKKFKNGDTRVLVSTNVLSRGIDVLQVGLVINYDIPMDKDNKVDFECYVHRVGRTARAGNYGVAITFIHDDQSYDQLLSIKDQLHRDIKEIVEKDFVEIDLLIRKSYQ
jgi:ATP-dependent RNA helicase DDX19/DBP5